MSQLVYFQDSFTDDLFGLRARRSQKLLLV